MDDRKKILRMDKLELMNLLQDVTEENDRLRKHCQELEEANSELSRSNHELNEACDALVQEGQELREQLLAWEESAHEEEMAASDFEKKELLGQDDPHLHEAYAEGSDAEMDGDAAEELATEEELLADLSIEEPSTEEPLLELEEALLEEPPTQEPSMEGTPKEPPEETPVEAPDERDAEEPKASKDEILLKEAEIEAAAQLPLGNFAEAMVAVQEIITRTQSAADAWLERCRQETESVRSESDTIVSQARAQADALLAEAHAQADTLLAEARAQADGIVNTARDKKESFERETLETGQRLRDEMERLTRVMSQTLRKAGEDA